MPQRMQIRRGTAAEWTSANPVLADGEMGFERGTNKIKFGDGVTAWNSLVYAGGSAYYANPIDKPPTTPNDIDDEFNGDSLNAKWLWLNQGSSSVRLENSIIELNAQNQSHGTLCRGIVQPVPNSIDFTIAAKFLGTNLWVGYAKAGLLISESLVGKQLGIWHAFDGVWKGLMGEFFTDPATRSSFGYYGPEVQPQGGYIKARLYKTGEVWYVDFSYSLNGIAWTPSKIGLAIGFTPAYIGMGWDFETSDTGKSYYDWFRITDIGMPL